MQDHEKTQDQLIDELNEMRRRVSELETAQYSAWMPKIRPWVTNLLMKTATSWQSTKHGWIFWVIPVKKL